MPQPRIYDNRAARQAAYLARKKSQQQTQAQLAALGRSLHAVIQTAVVYSAFPLPPELAAAKPEETLKNLTHFFDPIYDPVHNPKGKVKRRSEFFDMEETKANSKTQK